VRNVLIVGGYCNRHFRKCIIFNFHCCSTNVAQYSVAEMNIDGFQIQIYRVIFHSLCMQLLAVVYWKCNGACGCIVG
jgi:hypothetical protein